MDADANALLYAATNQFWDCLGGLCREALNTGEPASVRHEGRAIAFLREAIAKSTAPSLQEAERRIRLCQDAPAYAAALALDVAQMKKYQNSPPILWQLAREWIDESPIAAIAAINGDPRQIGQLALMVLRYLHKPGHKASRQGLIPPTMYAQRVRSLGGAWHFVMMALAVLLGENMRILFDIALGRLQDEDALHHGLRILALRDPRYRLAGVDALWIEPIAPRMKMLFALDGDDLALYAHELMRQRHLVEAVHADGEAAASAANRAARLAQAEAVASRKRIDQAQRQVDQLTRRLAARPAALAVAPAAAGTVAERDDGAALELRQLRRELEAAQARNFEHENELVMLREFCTLLLEPPAAPRTTPARGARLDLHAVRVIVVGGRDRLHQKLRRVLPRGVFLHPDLAACPADVFENADCVLYCMEYCSHGLARAAMDLARRHGVPAGYANHTNPELVLQKVREILGQPPAAAIGPCAAAA